MSAQTKEVVQYFTFDKELIKETRKDLLETVRALSQLVNFRRYKKDGEGAWVTVSEDKFFEEAEAPFKDLVLMLSAFSQSNPHMFRWRSPATEITQVEQEEPNPNPQGQPTPEGRLKRLISVGKQVASSVGTFLGPPLPPSYEAENVLKAKDLLDAFDQLQADVEVGTGEPKLCRQLLASEVAKIVGQIHSDTFRKAVDQLLEIDDISGKVIKEVV